MIRNEVVCGWQACTKTFDKKEELLPHLSNLHMSANHLKPSEVGIECKWKTCGDQHFSSVDDLFSHISVNHLLLSKEELQKPNVCLWFNCGSRFNNFESLTDHAAQIHVGNGRSNYICEWYRCERNGKPFVQRQKIMRHLQTRKGFINSDTGDKPFQCIICLQRFGDMSAVSQHQYLHSGTKQYRCNKDSCKKEFAIQSALIAHLRVHNGEKPYLCTVGGCERKFADASNLSKHKRVHTKEKPFKCPLDLCDKKFARSQQATRHLKVHRGER